MIKTEISRGFRAKGILFALFEKFFMWVKAAPASVGAGSLVLATITKPEAHGMFRRPYLTDEEYEV